jgi:hypothetical protein
LVLVIKSVHLRRFPSGYRLSSDHRLRLAEHEASASDSMRHYSPSSRPSSEPLHNRSGTDDLGTGSRQIRSPDNPSRSSSQSVYTPLQSVGTEPAQARGSSPYRSKRIRGRRAASPILGTDTFGEENKRRRQEEGDRLLSSSSEYGRRGSHSFQVPICRIHQDGTKVVVQEKTRNSVRTGAQTTRISARSSFVGLQLMITNALCGGKTTRSSQAGDTCR